MSTPSYYHSRIRKALRYISEHLAEDLNIPHLAKVSNFSTYHFHRIFKSITGETPYESLLRLRLEKAVFLLKHHQNVSISAIAYDSGFPSPENFSRQFKARFQISPSAFRKDKSLHNSRIYQEPNPDDFYLRIEESRKLEATGFTVELESLPPIPIAFTTAVFGMDGSGMVERYLELIAWAEGHGIPYKGAMTRFGMSIDNPEVTPASKFRYDFALKIDRVYPVHGNVELGEIPAAQYATVHVRGVLENVAQAWDFLYQHWLPQSGYVPVHQPAMEEFIQGPEEIGWETFNLKCRIPIQKEAK